MRIADLPRLRWLLGTLLIAAAALFAIGVATEGDVHHETVTTAESGEHNEATEQAAHNEPSEATESPETILGANLESTPLVAIAVTISIGLAVANWRTDRRLVLLITALFAIGFAVLDAAEFAHQIKQSATTVRSEEHTSELQSR